MTFFRRCSPISMVYGDEGQSMPATLYSISSPSCAESTPTVAPLGLLQQDVFSSTVLQQLLLTVSDLELDPPIPFDHSSLLQHDAVALSASVLQLCVLVLSLAPSAPQQLLFVTILS